jgi:hypothetical protein
MVRVELDEQLADIAHSTADRNRSSPKFVKTDPSAQELHYATFDSITRIITQ